MKRFISNPEPIDLIGTWNGEDSGEIFDWLTANGYPHCIQLELPDLTERRSEKEGEPVEPRKTLAILGKQMYQNITVEVGGDLAMRYMSDGTPYLSELYPGYLADGYHEAVE